MNINELGEDLEQQFGKPRNITEENVRFMLSLIKEEFDGTKVNENVEKPSLEAFGMTILAVMSYQTTLGKNWQRNLQSARHSNILPLEETTIMTRWRH